MADATRACSARLVADHIVASNVDWSYCLSILTTYREITFDVIKHARAQVIPPQVDRADA
jgi:hypothetical protein